jgi:hypothetical protein
MKKLLIIVVSTVLVCLLAGCTGISEAAAAASPAQAEVSANPGAASERAGSTQGMTGGKEATTEMPGSPPAAEGARPLVTDPSSRPALHPDITSGPVPGVITTATGYLCSAYTGSGANRIVIDYVEFYTGEEAIAEAAEDGYPPPPNEFYIRNDDTTLRTFALATSCTIELLDYTLPGPPLAEADYGYLESLSPFHAEEYLVNIQIIKGRVTHIWQEYIP